MKEFLVVINSGEYKCSYRYNKDGMLVACSLDPTLPLQAIQHMHKVMPYNEGLLMALPKLINNLVISESITDTSFKAFWEKFRNKVGNKPRAEKLYKLLSPEEKLQVIMSIKKYHNWLIQNPNVQQLYPETYLAQRRWENQF